MLCVLLAGCATPRPAPAFSCSVESTSLSCMVGDEVARVALDATVDGGSVHVPLRATSGLSQMIIPLPGPSRGAVVEATLVDRGGAVSLVHLQLP